MTRSETITVPSGTVHLALLDITHRGGVVCGIAGTMRGYELAVKWPHEIPDGIVIVEDQFRLTEHHKIQLATRLALNEISERTKNGWLILALDVTEEDCIMRIARPENTAGGTTERESAAPPVQHDLSNDPKQLPQPEI